MNSPIDEYFAVYGITHPSRMVHRIAGREIRRHAGSWFHGRMIEIGCGAKLKRYLVSGLVDSHLGIDLPAGPHGRHEVDVCATAEELPFRPASFDCALSTAVLEHLQDPEGAIRETARVLRRGGAAIFTAPMFWHLHEEPRDYFRYTKYALRLMFEAAGFEIVEITALSGFWVTFGSEWSYYLQRFTGRVVLRPLVHLLVALNNLIFPWLDRRFGPDDSFTWMNLIVATKR